MKALAWMARLALAAVIISGCTLYATWVTVHSYLDKVLAQYGVKGPDQKAKFSEFLAHMAENANILHYTGLNQEGATKPANGGNSTGAISEKSVSPVGSEQKKESGGEALPVWSRSGQQQLGQSQSDSEKKAGDAADQRKKVVFTTEQLQKTKDKISNEDKMKIFSLLVSRLPQDELQRISRLVEDGITSEELAQMEDIVEMQLTPSEYKQLLTILEKY